MDKLLQKHLVIFGVLLFGVLPLSIAYYHSHYRLLLPPQSGIVKNPDVLLDALPKNIVDATLISVKNYNNGLDSPASSYSVDGIVHTLDGAYNFLLKPAVRGDELSIKLSATNDNGVIGLDVFIDGERQPAVN